jgi:predicted  nucleic acid-binding Zn-ribbon protein
MSQNANEIRLEIRKTLDRMTALRDEARVKLNLASKDVRDGWNRLEPKIEEAERAAEQATKATLQTIQATAKKIEDLIASM